MSTSIPSRDPAGPTAGGATTERDARPGTGPSAGSATVAGLGVIGAVFALLAGGWLMYAPFALGYQSDFSTWDAATTTDFFDGLGIAILAVLALAVAILGLVSALTGLGALTPRRRRPAPRADTPAASGAPAGTSDELTALLRPLVEALARDNSRAAATPPLVDPAGRQPTAGTDPSGLHQADPGRVEPDRRER